MRLLATLDDYSLGLSQDPRTDEAAYAVHEAARAIIFNDRNQIALLHAVNFGYHKLPGGGIEQGESWQQACLREVTEETGCIARLRDIEVGQIVEWRGRPETWRKGTLKLKQISYCGVADVVGSESLNLTEEEVRVGLNLEWHSLAEAIAICEADEPLQDQDQPDNYEGRFIKNRDLVFLKEAKKILGS